MLREAGRLEWTHDVSLGNSLVSTFAKGAGGRSSVPHSNTWTGRRSISVLGEFVAVLQGWVTVGMLTHCKRNTRIPKYWKPGGGA